MNMVLHAMYKYTFIETIEIIQNVSNMRIDEQGLYFDTPSSSPFHKINHFTPINEVMQVELLDEDGNIMYTFLNKHRGDNYED